MSISVQIKGLKTRLEAARAEAPLAAPHIALLGASKGQTAEAITEAISCHMTLFGENRVQEAQEKWPSLRRRYPGVRLHLIGPLQTNKVEAAVEMFDAIQTVDREKLADALADAMQKTGKRPECYIQVNTGKEPQKAGVAPEEADALIRYCRKMGLPLVGLMCVPPAGEPPAAHFALLRTMAQKHGITELSMGMSEDFETAIRMGSTCVRLGRALFGERPQ